MLLDQHVKSLRNTAANPDWILLTSLWSPNVNGSTIFYMSPELLRSYYNIKADRSTALICINANTTAIKEVSDLSEKLYELIRAIASSGPVQEAQINGEEPPKKQAKKERRSYGRCKQSNCKGV
ncbi:hypothetical protein [Parasitella parasitica]|uniref:Uncharacterized protein n=1 Tax=Parasitella parasitica TaxID=35722 RepID=A0A0B7MRG9_9FUNG|nr:hypothetical protein [Parasitella parasitica]